MAKDSRKKAQLTIHIGTQKVSQREPILHEKSILKQLKTIIEKNRRIIQDSEE